MRGVRKKQGQALLSVYRKKDGRRLCKPPFSVRNAISPRASAIATGIVVTARVWSAFAYAWMASIIVRNAGKHAKSAWRIPMTDELARVVFHFDQDAFLVGVLRTAVQFQASQAGFETETCGEIGQASEDVCREAVSKLTDADGGLDVTLATFADRIEVAIQHRGQVLPPVGLETFAFSDDFPAGTGGINGLELLSRVDRVLYSTDEGNLRTTLVKFLKPKN
jgi:hypothetical protein